MTDERGTLRSIAWRELCPWLILFRTFTLSLSLPLLLLALVGVLIQPLGWRLARVVFISDAALDGDADFRWTNERLTTWPGQARHETSYVSGVAQGTFSQSLVRQITPPGEGDFAGMFDRLSLPFRQLFNIRLSLTKFAYFLAGGLWSLAIWAFIGGVVTRVSVVKLGREERLSIKDAFLFVGRKYLHYFFAPLYPLIGVSFLTLCVALVGLVMWGLGNVGVVIAGVLWIFVLLASLAMAFILLGLMFGWPLMWPTISAENGDPFEALSRSFGYTFQRPLHYLFFAVVATLFGSLCWLLVAQFAAGVQYLAWWGASWGAGSERILQIQMAAAGTADSGTALSAGAWLLNVWNGLVEAFATAFAYSFFFCTASAIYLLLRQVDDETEFDEIYSEDDEQRFTLPPLKKDAAGVATVSDTESPPAEPDQRPLAEEE
jgi:hypothetical protein